MEFTCNEDVLKSMYRYLLRYVGTYRVKAELDLSKNDFPREENGEVDDSFEDLYIPCSKGVIKHTYLGKNILVLCCYDKASQARNIYTALKEKYPKIEIELDDEESDGMIYFYAKDIKKIATVCKPKTSGKDIPPFSSKNLPKISYKIPAKDLQELYDITKDLDKGATMRFYKSVNADFLKSLGKKAQAEKLQLRLGTREYIHYAGLWEKYLKYVKRKYSKYSKQDA